MPPANLILRNTDKSNRSLSQKHLSERTGRFLQRLRNYTERGMEVFIDLSNPGWISLPELCAIATAIRLHANHAHCIIKMPGLEAASQAFALYHLRFPFVLGHDTKDQEWQDNIDFQDYTPPTRRGKERIDFLNTIPLTWIDAHSFGIDPNVHNIYSIDPPLDKSYSESLRSRLIKGGFVSTDDVDEFINTIFRELAWNAVLHSQDGNIPGFAVFAGQVFNTGTVLNFTLVDAGVGVVRTLSAPYKEALEHGKTHDFAAKHACSEASAVLRYAFEPESTSRTAFQNDIDRFSDRGLAIVADAIIGNGTLHLYSNRGAAIIPNSKQKDYYLFDLPVPYVGTILAGELVTKKRTGHQLVLDLPQEIEPTQRNSNYIPAIVVLENYPRTWSKYFRRICQKLPQDRIHCVIDFGFGETILRKIEQFLAAAINNLRPSILIAINTPSSSISPTRLQKALVFDGQNKDCTLYILTGNETCKVLTIPKWLADENSVPKRLRWKEKSLTLPTVCAIQYLANTGYAEWNFQGRHCNTGFYKGRIHLVNGKQTDRYFSLLAHASTNAGAHTRWTNTIDQLVSTALLEDDTNNLVLLGFAASIRPLLHSLPVVYNSFEKAYCLLSYDVPTREELKRILKDDDRVVLCTDVLSSGSLLSEIAQSIHNLGASVVAVVALYDTRDDSIDQWKSTFDPKIGSLPLYVGGRFIRLISAEVAYRKPEYWADPVSAIPSVNPPYSQIDISRVSRAADVLRKTNAIQVGHFVQGTRHTSLRVDVTKILQVRETIIGWINEEKASLAACSQWRHFDPTHLFVPAGIDRLEEIAFKGSVYPGSQSAREFAELVCSTYSNEAGIEIFEVPRTFEPGGQARCSGIEYLGKATRLGDVLIVDDGISTGSTLRSVLQQLVRRGAKRILVFILLARCSFEELEHWKLTQQISAEPEAGMALVKVRYLLHLPIPFATQSDCPQCVSLSTLSARYAAVPGLEYGWKAINQDLLAPYIYQSSCEPNQFREFWIEYHTLAELATRSSQYFENLRTKLEELVNDDARRLEREVVVRLFLVEWRLLARARLRQIARQIVVNVACKQLHDKASDDQRIIEALSLIRAVAPRDYAFNLRSILDRVTESELVIDRVLIHVYGLLPSVQYGEWRDTLYKLDRLLRTKPVDMMPRIESQRGFLDTLLSNHEDAYSAHDPVDRFHLALEAISGEEARHLAIGPLVAVANVGPEAVMAKGTEHCASLARQFERINQWFGRYLYPHFGFLHEPLDHILKDLSLLNKVHYSYLEPNNSGKYGAQTDIEACIDALRIYSEGVGTEIMLKNGFKSLRRVVKDLFAVDSPIKLAMYELISLSVKDVVELTQRSLEAYFPNAMVELDCSNIQDDLDAWKVYCPPSYVNSWVSLVRSNIERWVIQEGKSEAMLTLRVYASFDVRSALHTLSLLVANNGPQLKGEPNVSRMSRKFARTLERYGATFMPVTEGVGKLPVAARLGLRILRV